ncbi:MAG: hypothetical protein M3426_10060 [Actinomycetota bacterium]|nr:hypothetical protein [Actinomycetota bacterium]
MADVEGRLAWRKSEQAVSRPRRRGSGGMWCIGVGASGARVSGELREVSDRGVVLHYDAEQHGRDPGHVFYPWSNVQAIQLPDEEQPADEEQPSGSGE